MERMNNKVFQPLVVLEKKPIATKFQDVRVAFQKMEETMEQIQQEESQQEIDETNEENPEKTTENQPKNIEGSQMIEIIDRRKTSVIDRNVILQRLKDRRVVNNTLDVSTIPIIEEQNLILPIKTGEKITIKPKFTQPVSVEIEEKTQPITETTQIVSLIEPVEELKKIEEKEQEEAEKIAIGEVLESVVEPVVGKPKRGRKPKKQQEPEILSEVDITTALIRNQKVLDRLPKEKEKVIIKAPTYYMNNRKLFIQKLTKLFEPYQKELLETQESVSCESRSQNDEFQLLTHQKLVRDYLNLYTPYRGLLLYHNLGTGKSCTSIAIAEGMKSNKRVFVLTPASLKMNFFSEMKKCGDDLYKKNQFWEFVSIDGNTQYLGILSRALSIPVEFIRRQNGAWLVNIQKESNYTELEPSQQIEIDEQLNEMIRSKYTDINYNGLNANKMKVLTSNYTRNPFDNSVVVIDEAHNFVSRIVNKLKTKSKKSIPYMMYDYLMNATNARIVLLSGTPIINYPNEIGILYNILRGYIKSWTIPAIWEKADKINTDTILKILDDGKLKTFDYVEYADNKITITRNPFGFISTKKSGALKGTQRNPKMKVGGKNRTKKNKSKQFIKIPTLTKDEITEEEDASLQQDKNEELKDLYSGGASDIFDRYNGVKLDETGNLTDDDFINQVQTILKKNGITIRGNIELNKYKALPDDAESFLNMFVNIEEGKIKETNLFQRRILGLTSYFRSAQEQLLPKFVKTDAGDTYDVMKCEMSQHQYGIYEKIRKDEAETEKKNRKAQMKNAGKQDAEDLFNISSTYRIFSRACCNFAFPEGIDRPLPKPKSDIDTGDSEISELEFDAVPKEIRQDVDVYEVSEEQEDVDSVPDNTVDQEELKYEKRIENAMQQLNKKIEGTEQYEYLSKDALGIYSPKFAKILENITNPENDGLHLLYSHFRTIEGIGILRLVLLANGFAEFKLKKIGENWDIVETIEDEGKPRFVLYTGTEGADEKEIIRNVFNGMWDFVPGNIATKLKQKAENNNYGEIIKVFMITSSGAEGINLRNTRFVHITEAYWHMVRIDQVVGRARRICSHQDLPEDKRTVKVFLYVATLSEAQKTDEKNVELRIRDVSSEDGETPITTDESLYEKAIKKQNINNQILRAVKESAIDCNIYSVLSKKDDPDNEKLVCYGFGKVESNQFSSYPTLEKDQSEKSGLDVKRVDWIARKVKIANRDYAMNERTEELYDFESYQRATQGMGEPILVGRLVNEGNKKKFVPV